MKKFYLSLLLSGFISCIISSTSNAQGDWCSSEILFREKAKENPALQLSREQLENETRQFIAQNQNQKSTGVVKIIPVVFHVIHEGGSENISRAQIVDQVDSLNKDFRRQNGNAVNTPLVFQSVAADCEIEFRLAQLDPNGNCTDGVTRTFSHLTTNARVDVKAPLDWPSNKYLNIWIVKSIENTSGNPGDIIGFAQFPGGSALTDGVVLRYDYTGSIGTAASNNGVGRTATHEIGHWLNLRHIWGDANCGDDFVSDTPTADQEHYGCPIHPFHVNVCGTGSSPDGEMFPNYMDYTDGACQNLFTNGQNLRMQATLISGVSGRNNLWSASNLTATGTDGTPPVTCAPVADFNSEIIFICEGTTLNFIDGSWNGTVTTWSWQFPGGNPSSSNSQNPSIQYNSAGVYDVILTVSNSGGTDTKTATGMVVVSPALGANNSYPWQESFESITVPGNDWYVLNSAGNAWEQSTIAAHTGSTSMRIYNYTGNPDYGTDDLITTSFNLTNVSSTTMTFWRAFAYRSTSAADRLRIFTSTNCGQLWTLKYVKSGMGLSTAGLVAANFVPSVTQWDADTVNLSSSTVSGKPNVRFKFEYSQDSGNNIYLDDINLDGVVGMNEVFSENVKFEVYPNPAQAKAHISFNLSATDYVELKIFDVTGREVRNLTGQNLEAGEYQYDVDGTVANGVYYVRLTIGNSSSTKKLVLN